MAICILLVVIVLLVIVWIWDCNHFVVMPYEIESDLIFKDLKIAVLTDLHEKEYGKNHSKLVKGIKKQNPDAIMIAGDLMTASESPNVEGALTLLEQLSEYPVFFANGNHETKIRVRTEKYPQMYSTFLERADACGVRFVNNTQESLEKFNVSVYGIELERSFFKRLSKVSMDDAFLESVLGPCPKDKFTILLAHNPEYFEAYQKWGADLILSGHVHGGIMRLPFLGGVISPSFFLFPKYDGGYFERERARMILSRGLGTHTIPIRIFNPGELPVITIRKKRG